MEAAILSLLLLHPGHDEVAWCAPPDLSAAPQCALEETPPRAAASIGRELLVRGMPAEAARVVRSAAEHDPEAADVLADAKAALGDVAGAKAARARAAELRHGHRH